MTFIDRCVGGKVLPAGIDNYIAAWHESETELSLSTFLGLSSDEYASWLEHPELLSEIIEARVREKTIQ